MKIYSKNSATYQRLFEHCQKQYKNISTIKKAYIENNQVFGIDYITKNGLNSIACDTFKADKVIYFN